MRVAGFALGLAAAATLAAAPLSPASAHDHWGRRGGHGGPGIFFPLAIAGAVVGTAAAIVTAPVRALADAASAPVYAAPAPAPVYAAPAPAYYAAPAPQAPAYYAPQQQAPAYYPPPPQAYYPPPAAYSPPPGYAYYPPR